MGLELYLLRGTGEMEEEGMEVRGVGQDEGMHGVRAVLAERDRRDGGRGGGGEGGGTG